MTEKEALEKLVNFVNLQLSGCSEMFQTFESQSEADSDKEFLSRDEAVSLIEEFSVCLDDIGGCIKKQNLEYEARAEKMNKLAVELENEADKLIKNITALEEKMKPFGLKTDQSEVTNLPKREDIIVDDSSKVIDDVKIENLISTPNKAASNNALFSGLSTPESPKCTTNVEETTKLLLNMGFGRKPANGNSKALVKNIIPDVSEPLNSCITNWNKQKGNIFRNDDTPESPKLTVNYNFGYTQGYNSSYQLSETTYKIPSQIELGIPLSKTSKDLQVKTFTRQPNEPLNRELRYPDTPESPKIKTKLDETQKLSTWSKSDFSQTSLFKGNTPPKNNKNIFGRNDETPKTPELTSKYHFNY